MFFLSGWRQDSGLMIIRGKRTGGLRGGFLCARGYRDFSEFIADVMELSEEFVDDVFELVNTKVNILDEFFIFAVRTRATWGEKFIVKAHA